MRKRNDQIEYLKYSNKTYYITITIEMSGNPDEKEKSVAVTAILLLSQQHRCSHSNRNYSYMGNNMVDFSNIVALGATR